MMFDHQHYARANAYLIGRGKLKSVTIGRRRLVVCSSLEELANA